MMRVICFALLTFVSVSSFSSAVMAKELSRRVAGQVQSAFQLQSQQKMPEAIQVLKKVESQRKYDNAYVQRMLGILYWQTQQLEPAERALKQSVSLAVLSHQQQIETQRMLADIQLTQAKFASAIKNYRKILDLNTQEPVLKGQALYTVWLRIAQSEYQLQRYSSSLISVSRYVSSGGEMTTGVLNLRLGSQLALKQWSNAIKTTMSLKALEPNNPLWWQQQVSLYLRVGNTAQALATLKQFERAGFSLTTAQYKLMAQLYGRQNIPEKAAQIYKKQINNDVSNSADDLAIEARYWQMSRGWKLALAAWKRASKDNVNYRWSYIDLLRQQKQFDTAITELAKMKSSQRKELALVSIFYQRKDITAALQHAQKAHRILPDKQTRSWLTYLNSIKPKV